MVKELQSARGGLSDQRKRIVYWIFRGLLMVVAGGLGYAFATSIPIAIYLGASAPALLDRLSRVKA